MPAEFFFVIFVGFGPNDAFSNQLCAFVLTSERLGRLLWLSCGVKPLR
jgi:hypothetical protein